MIVLLFLIKNILCKTFKITKGNICKILTSIIILAAIIIPLTIPYISLQKNFGFQRAVENIEGISPDLFDYFVSPFVFKYYSPLLQEWVVGPGIFVMILLIISMFSIYKKSVNIKRSLIYF